MSVRFGKLMSFNQEIWYLSVYRSTSTQTEWIHSPIKWGTDDLKSLFPSLTNQPPYTPSPSPSLPNQLKEQNKHCFPFSFPSLWWCSIFPYLFLSNIVIPLNYFVVKCFILLLGNFPFFTEKRDISLLLLLLININCCYYCCCF